MMAGPWEKYQTAPAPAAAPASGPWSGYQQQSPSQPYSGSVLPFSKDAQGNVHFDSNAGILGAIKNAFTLPHDVMTGQVDPTSDQGIARAANMGALAGMDAAAPGVGAIMKRARVDAPSAEALYNAADSAFNRLRNSGVDYASSAVRDWAQAMKNELDQNGFDATVAPNTHNTLDKLSSPPAGSVAGIANLHSARKTFGHVARNFNNPTDQAAASHSINGLDSFIENADPASVVAGAPAAAADALKEANGNYAAAKRSDRLTGIERTADLRAAAANSGRNIGNATRQRVASLLTNNKQASGFTPEEVAALEGVVKGSPIANATRYLGNLLGGGGGLGQMLSAAAGAMAGGHFGGIEGAGLGSVLPTAAGAASKAASNALTEGALRAVDEMTRQRSPLYDQMAANAPMIAMDPAKRTALIRALMIERQNMQAQQ